MQAPGELSHSSSSETDPGSLLEAQHYWRQPIHFTWVSRVLKALLRGQTNLRLRTKLLLWLVLFTAVLTCATLPLVRPSAHAPVPRQIGQYAPHAIPRAQSDQHHAD